MGLIKDDTQFHAVKKFIDKIETYCQYGTYIFRGVNQVFEDKKKEHEYKISSSLYRKYSEDKTLSVDDLDVSMAEKRMVQWASTHFPNQATTIEKLTDLQHFGGKTALIDFSYNLYVALFFACNGEHGKCGDLIALNSRILEPLSDIDYDNDKNDKPDKKKNYLIRPSHTQVSKMRAMFQSSVFVYTRRGYISSTHPCVN